MGSSYSPSHTRRGAYLVGAVTPHKSKKEDDRLSACASTPTPMGLCTPVLCTKEKVHRHKQHGSATRSNANVKTPVQKPSKKIRPKVVREDKPKRAPIEGENALTTTFVKESACLPNTSCKRLLNLDYKFGRPLYQHTDDKGGWPTAEPAASENSSASGLKRKCMWEIKYRRKKKCFVNGPQTCQEALFMDRLTQKITKKLRSKRISYAVKFSAEKDENTGVLQNAIMPYSAEGTIVPYAGIFRPKRRPRPKVDLDEKTIMEWKLLMGTESAGKHGTDADKEKWWEKERGLFRGRADSFITRMHLIQGDRRFSQWKGSVVDSVVGVFLTQNAADHLSSSAFMALAACFPLNKERDNKNLNDFTIQAFHQIGSSIECATPEEQVWNEWKINLEKGLGRGCPLQIDNCFKINSESKYSSTDTKATTSITIFSHEAHRINSLGEADLQFKISQEGYCWMAEGSFPSSSKMEETEFDSKDGSKPRKPRKKIHRSNKGKGEAVCTKVTWEPLRRRLMEKIGLKERTDANKDSLDWEAVRLADVNEVAQAIKERGMNNMLAARIQEFLNRMVEDHGSIDLEWLREVPPDKAKDFLLSINGLGIKSAECVRLLCLQQHAFPVDTNVGRICVRLGWVPLQPLPESLQLHLVEEYPFLESIQSYLWPRLCKLDLRTLYELHYQLITFGKVFCTKKRPNCNVCPMRGECKHFASAFASARLCLPAPEEKSSASSSHPFTDEQGTGTIEGISKCEPIIEEPATPQIESLEDFESAIEDFNPCDPDEILTIKLNLQDNDLSKALVALTPQAASIPTLKLKNVSRLRTEHSVYQLPDDHPLLKGLDKRECDDPYFYLLAIWTPGETAESIEPPTTYCDFKALEGSLCNKPTCFSCNAFREATAQTVRGTLLIPCRTAMRGRFPLNGTYFQVNEVFADHESSLNPLSVPRALIWNLPMRTVYFGTSVTTIFRGRGFVCVRGFDLTTRAPRPLLVRFHFPASKQTKSKRTTAKKSDE